MNIDTELLMAKSKPGGAGIDYSRGTANTDTTTGIHYGVISQHEVLQAWADSSEADFGTPGDMEVECPDCGHCFFLQPREIPADAPYMVAPQWEWGDMVACPKCESEFDLELPCCAEPIGYDLNDGDYVAYAGDDGDIFIISSPYYTYCGYCSPCAPGAGHLMSPFRLPPEYKKTAEALADISPDTGSEMYQELAIAAGFPKTFCFGHDWFDAVKQGEVQCQYCKGTGKRKVSDIRVANFDIERFISNGGKVIDGEHVQCWVCRNGMVDNMVSKAPYRVFNRDTGEEVYP
jgi:hypothetical protein